MLEKVIGKSGVEEFRKIWNKLYESADLEFIGYNDSTENKKLSSEYVELYKKYFFSESTLKELLAKDSSVLLNTKNTVDSTYDGLNNIFAFLVANQGKWEVSNGNVVFADFSLMAQFIALKTNI